MKGHVMRAQMKSAPAQIKAAGDGDGIVEALVATYAVDSGGDRIVPGAFADTLDEWAASGKTMPFIWAHQHDDIDAYLGDVLEAKEVDDGLYVKAQVDMERPEEREGVSAHEERARRQLLLRVRSQGRRARPRRRERHAAEDDRALRSRPRADRHEPRDAHAEP
jgi:hypothetical protein